MKKVKVVILNWNGKRHLERFLPSVVANTPRGTGIIVADNGSTDGSAEFIRYRFPTVGFLCLGHNHGYAEGYNKALSSSLLSDTEYFVLLNSDVETPKGWLEPLLRKIDGNTAIAAVSPKILSMKNPGSFEYAGAAGGFMDWFGYPFCRGRILSRVEEDKGQYNDAREVFWASGACMIVRSSAFREAGGFDPSFFAHMEEIDLCWRFWARGWKVVCEPRSYVYHLGGGTLSNESPRKLYLNYRNNLFMLYKNLSPVTFRSVIFIRMMLDGVSALVYLLSGRKDSYKAVLLAHKDYRKEKPSLKNKRRDNMALRRNSPEGIYKGSVILRYLLGCRIFRKMM